MNSDLSDLVLDGMHDIVELQKHNYTDNAVGKTVKYLQPLVDILNQPAVRIEMNCLNVYVHSYHGFKQ